MGLGGSMRKVKKQNKENRNGNGNGRAKLGRDDGLVKGPWR